MPTELKNLCCALMSYSYLMQIPLHTYMQNNVASMLYKFWKTFNLCSTVLWLQYAPLHLSLGLQLYLFLFWSSKQSSNMHLTRGKHGSWARFHFVTINLYLSLWHGSLSHYCKHLSFCFAVCNLATLHALDLTVI